MRHVLPLLPKDAMVVLDNGEYSKDNAKLLDSKGLGFVTRLQLNITDT
jgi:transposase